MNKKKILVINNGEEKSFKSLFEAIDYAVNTYKQTGKLSAVFELHTGTQTVLLCGKVIELTTAEELKKFSDKGQGI